MILKVYIKKLAFLFVLLSVLTVYSQQNQVSNSDGILLMVSAWSKDRGYLRDLKPEDFEVYEGKQSYTITTFKRDDEPMSIGILVDLSGSMERPLNTVPFVADGLVELVNRSNAQNEYFIIGFAKRQTLILDESTDKVKIFKALKALASSKAEGNTFFFEALNAGLERVSKGKFRKKALVVVSDGTDNRQKEKILAT